MNTDKKALSVIEKIKSRIDELKKREKVPYETHLRFPTQFWCNITDNISDTKNLSAFDVNSLYRLHAQLSSMKSAKYGDKITIVTFNLNQWISDIEKLIEAETVANEIASLTKMLQRAEGVVSTEAKAEAILNEIENLL